VPADLRRYTDLPADLPPVVAQTAGTVAGQLSDPIDQATALRDFFRDGSFTYDPGFTAGDDEAAVSTFLRDRRGFCVQFATAYALMARALGIPARVAVGFTPGAHDAATGTFTVSNHDAHAWPELWFAGLGWTHMFDPTPTSDLPGAFSCHPRTWTSRAPPRRGCAAAALMRPSSRGLRPKDDRGRASWKLARRACRAG